MLQLFVVFAAFVWTGLQLIVLVKVVRGAVFLPQKKCVALNICFELG